MNELSLITFTSQVEGAYTTLCQPVLNEFGISQTSFDILMFLTNQPEHYTAREISQLRNIKANVVSLHVEKLVQDGYLERKSVEGDRRKIRLVCTDKAKKITEKGHAVQQTFFERLMDGLSENDLEEFKHCFRVIAKNVDRIQAGKKYSVKTEG